VRVCTISGLMKNMCSSVLFVFNSDYKFFRPGRFHFRVCIIPSRVSEEMETTPLWPRHAPKRVFIPSFSPHGCWVFFLSPPSCFFLFFFLFHIYLIILMVDKNNKTFFFGRSFLALSFSGIRFSIPKKKLLNYKSYFKSE
jgi:hypothetical protein